MPRRIVRLANQRSGTSGSGARSSIAMKAANEDRRDDEGDDGRRGAPPRSPTQVTASTSAATATLKRDGAGDVELPPLASGSMCGTATTASASAMRPTGMLIQNTHRQPHESVISSADERPDEDRDGERGADDRQHARALARRS